jgi:hypothetical protein
VVDHASWLLAVVGGGVAEASPRQFGGRRERRGQAVERSGEAPGAPGSSQEKHIRTECSKAFQRTRGLRDGLGVVAQRAEEIPGRHDARRRRSFGRHADQKGSADRPAGTEERSGTEFDRRCP